MIFPPKFYCIICCEFQFPHVRIDEIFQYLNTRWRMLIFVTLLVLFFIFILVAIRFILMELIASQKVETTNNYGILIHQKMDSNKLKI